MPIATLILDLAEVEYRVECLEEDIPVRGQFDSGDPQYAADDREIEDKIIRDLESGNPWAWCRIRVVARIGMFEGSDCLAGCSYASEQDFTGECDPSDPTSTGYYADMRVEALANLKAKLLAAGFTISD